MIPSPDKATVVVRVKVENGEIREFYGRKLSLKEGTVGELIVPRFAISDPKMKGDLANKKDMEIIPKDTKLLINMVPPEKDIEETKKKYLIDTNTIKTSFGAVSKGFLVESIVETPLILQLRGTKKARLLECKCWLPALEKEARSLNHAYTLLSEYYEVDRLSHTGNVFTKVLFQDKDGAWKPLDELRMKYETEDEKRFF